MVESEVGESFEEKDIITTAGGETSISQASDTFVELGARVGDVRMTALHIRYRSNEEQWGDRAGEGGRHLYYFVPQGDTHKETEEHMGC
jgi:hypothetical protein